MCNPLEYLSKKITEVCGLNDMFTVRIVRIVAGFFVPAALKTDE